MEDELLMRNIIDNKQCFHTRVLLSVLTTRILRAASSSGYHYALTVIFMLIGYTFCISLKTKTASELVQAYKDRVCVKFWDL